MLKQRVITALILLPIALGGFFLLEGWAFALFIGAVVSLAAWEWARLAGLSAQSQRVAYGVAVAALLYGAWLLPALAPWLLAAALLWELSRHVLIWYFGTLSQIGTVYGSLTTAIAVLLSLEIAATLLLFGAQVISEFERLGDADAV